MEQVGEWTASRDRYLVISRPLAVAFKREEKRGGRTGIYTFLADSIRDKNAGEQREKKESKLKRVGLADDRPTRRRSISGFAYK